MIKSHKRGSRSNSFWWTAELLHFFKKFNKFLFLFRSFVENRNNLIENFVLFFESFFILFSNFSFLFFEKLIVILFSFNQRLVKKTFVHELI